MRSLLALMVTGSVLSACAAHPVSPISRHARYVVGEGAWIERKPVHRFHRVRRIAKKNTESEAEAERDQKIATQTAEIGSPKQKAIDAATKRLDARLKRRMDGVCRRC